jgi:hypothetical protein
VTVDPFGKSAPASYKSSREGDISRYFFARERFITSIPAHLWQIVPVLSARCRSDETPIRLRTIPSAADGRFLPSGAEVLDGVFRPVALPDSQVTGERVGKDQNH